MHVFIADDEQGIRTLISKIADAEGLDWTACANGTQLVKALANHAGHAIVFLDLQMPEKDGIEVLQMVSQFMGRRPIYLMTGGPDANANVARALGTALGLNVVGTLKKPFSVTALRTLLRENADSSEDESPTGLVVADSAAMSGSQPKIEPAARSADRTDSCGD